MPEDYIELQTKISFQERTIEELNEVLIHQQGQIDKLITQLKQLELSFKASGLSLLDPADDSPPPHY